MRNQEIPAIFNGLLNTFRCSFRLRKIFSLANFCENGFPKCQIVTVAWSMLPKQNRNIQTILASTQISKFVSSSCGRSPVVSRQFHTKQEKEEGRNAEQFFESETQEAASVFAGYLKP